MAQYYCIKKWIEEFYPDRELLMFESDTVLYKKWGLYGGFLKLFKKVYNQEDIIVFQSGYTTTDLGGNHDEMHCAVIRAIPSARILMMPQTIKFVNEERSRRTSEIYNCAKNMLFLARDRVSYDMAVELFPNIQVKQFPDIVTSLIGTQQFVKQRRGVCICCRNDGERYYTDQDFEKLKNKIETSNVYCEITDTTLSVDPMELRNHIENFILREVNKYSEYKVIITDRYHGTILALVANTPVIVIKTVDHKVITGVEWFKGVYDDRVFFAEDLNIAYNMAINIHNKIPKENTALKSYFKESYYDNLKFIFDRI